MNETENKIKLPVFSFQTKLTLSFIIDGSVNYPKYVTLYICHDRNVSTQLWIQVSCLRNPSRLLRNTRTIYDFVIRYDSVNFQDTHFGLFLTSFPMRIAQFCLTTLLFASLTSTSKCFKFSLFRVWFTEGSSTQWLRHRQELPTITSLLSDNNSINRLTAKIYTHWVSVCFYRIRVFLCNNLK